MNHLSILDPMEQQSTQVLVIGGGPGGSTAATLLARQGIRVTLVEREILPRYHIGESLLPSCLRIFDLLGVREKVEAHGFLRKEGGLFDWGGGCWEIEFGTLTRPLYGFQVIRSEFDHLLLCHARSQGVEIREGVEVKEIVFRDERPVAAVCAARDGTQSRISFDVLIDASGRTGIMAVRYLHSRRYHEAFMNVATWGYWEGARRPSGPPGAIATCSVPTGWVWAIPLHDGTLSVGTVMHRTRFKRLVQERPLEEVYHQAVASSRVVGPLLEGARMRSSLRSETDYSYAAERFAGPGWFLVGDAACFLDPLLSTGVHLATFSGLVAAASVASLLRGEVDEAEAVDFYGASYRRAYLRMLVVVSAFYQTHRERDEHFRAAQRLTSHDYGGGELVQAFLHIVTGIEDLAEVEELDSDRLLEVMTRLYDEHYAFIRQKDGWGALSLEDINRGIARTRVVNAVQEEFSLTPETAVHGLYVAAEPMVGLRRAVAASGDRLVSTAP